MPRSGGASASGRARRDPGTRSTARSLVASNATTVETNALPSGGVDSRVADPGDDVRVRHDEAARRDPARSLDAETARDPGDADDALRRAHDVGILREPLVRRGDDRRRAEEDADRIDALELLEQALGRNDVVDLGEDQRALHRAAQLGLAREVEEHGADRPAQEDAGDEAEHETGEPIEQAACPGITPMLVRSIPASIPARPRMSVPQEDRAAERHDRDVRRTVAQDQRREPRAEVRAEGEARERERPAQESRRDPVEPGDSDDDDDDPVRGGHVQ